MDRREALARISLVIGGSISAPALTSLFAGCASPDGDERPTQSNLPTLTSQALRIAADIIIPRTDTPGAVDAGVDGFIEALLADYFSPSNRASFLTGLDSFLASADQVLSRGFTTATPTEQLSFMELVDRATFPLGEADKSLSIDPNTIAFFRSMKQLVVAGYYTSEAGATIELHMAPYGSYQGDISFESVGKTWA
jgi:hypothetical protein